MLKSYQASQEVNDILKIIYIGFLGRFESSNNFNRNGFPSTLNGVINRDVVWALCHSFTERVENFSALYKI